MASRSLCPSSFNFESILSSLFVHLGSIRVFLALSLACDLKLMHMRPLQCTFVQKSGLAPPFESLA